MGRGASITDEERGEIRGRLANGQSLRSIAKDLHRSLDLVRNSIDRGLDHPPGVSTGRKRKLDPRTVRNVRRHGSNQVTSAGKIRRELDLDCSDSTVLRVLGNSGYLAYEKKQTKPAINEDNVAQRLAFAEAHVQWDNQWNLVVFSDEKKFNLDGPDGFAYYWHDLRKGDLIFSTRQHGGGSVMIWVAISHTFSADVVEIPGTLNATRYKQILQTHLVPICDEIQAEYEEHAVFQQDNARPHVAHTTLDWLDERGIDYLEWPSKSPDLNPVENIFGILARHVYHENRQFATLDELRAAIQESWDEIGQEEIAAIIDSMHHRMVAVIASHGSYTKY